MLTGLLITILLIYLLLIGWLTIGFDKVEDFKLQDLDPKTTFSIVIPFRNEEKSLPDLLKSIDALDYYNTKFEVILVDDESDDDSVEVIEDVLDSSAERSRSTSRRNNRDTRTDVIRIIKNKRTTSSPKKDAISSAIKNAKYDWIITTDADCILPKYWLKCYDEFIQTNRAVAIAGPVKFTGASSFFNRFQILDTLSLQGATIGGFGIKKPFMNNGANFAYKKSTFIKAKGFEGNSNISSGDDVFLLEKFIKYDKTKVHYLKSDQAIVTTKVTESVSEFVNQRLRWASKSSHYKAAFPKLIGLSVFGANLVLVSLVPLVVFQVLFLKTALLLFLIKSCIDVLLIFKMARFFKQESVLLSYPFVNIIYPFYNTYIVTLLPFKSFNWKGRSFKK